MVFRAHTVNAAGLDQFVFLVGIGKYRAAVTVTAERFGRIEGSGRHVGDRTGLFAFVYGTVRLAGIRQHLHAVARKNCNAPHRQHLHAVLVSDFDDLVIIAGRTENINRDHRLQIQFSFFLNLVDRALQVFRIHIVSVGIGIHENRGCSQQNRRFGRSDESKGGNEDSVAFLYAPGHQGQSQGIGSRTTGGTIFNAGICGQFLVQFLGFRSLAVGTVVQNIFKSLQKLVLPDDVLGGFAVKQHNRFVGFACHYP